jgi:hypothetical protein
MYIDNTPLTPEELEELLAYLCDQHPPFYAELMRLGEARQLHKVPILLRTLQRAMQHHAKTGEWKI